MQPTQGNTEAEASGMARPQADRRVRIELGAEGVVGEYRAARDDQAGGNQERAECVSHVHHFNLIFVICYSLLLLCA